MTGLDDEIGSLDEGKKADLLAIRVNPLEDITALEGLVMVMRNGRVLLSRLPGIETDSQ